ncbi:MAG: O-antigen ligase family protein [Bacteroidetes bacterium]|nr:O-antigen ligase family protein [Bacteroidota bacterium]
MRNSKTKKKISLLKLLQSGSKEKWLFLIAGAFILLNTIAIALEWYWFSVLPLFAALALLAALKLDLLLIAIVFLVPLSINIEDIGLGLGISLPDEPLIIGVFLLVVYKFIIDGEYDFKVLKHPITIAILVNTAWIFFTCLTSQEVIVSFKFLLSRIWYIVLFYFLGVVLFKKFNRISEYLWAYMIPLAGVVIWTLIKHSDDNFSQVTSFEIMAPFYIAHGIYAAAIAFFIPLLAIYLLFGFRIQAHPGLVIAAAFLFLLFSAGVAFSFTRAAWLSLAGAAGFAILMIFRVRLWQMLSVLAFASLFIVANFDDIFFQLYQNKQNSAEGFEKHLESVSNVRNDVSNLERVNRWMAAINMAAEKPIVGFGPGAYSFTYAPYQDPEFKTPITTAFGDQGHAHSEFLNPLAETGWPGMLTIVAVLLLVFHFGLNLVYHSPIIQVRMFSAAILLGLITYYIHGLLNNYSEQDKIAVLIWGAFAMITAMDLYHKNELLKE